MNEPSENGTHGQSYLPSIKKTEDESLSINQLDKSQDDNNVLPLTHANKKKKHRKKFRKHSLQYYEQKKVQKVNKKLQQKWDSHFINDQIPDLCLRKKNRRPVGKTLSKLTNEKKSTTVLNNRQLGSTVGHFNSKKQSLPLPRIEKNPKRSKSFNVHVVSHKTQDHPEKNQKKLMTQKQTKVQQKLSVQVVEPKRKRQSQQSKRAIDQQNKNEKSHTEEYGKVLNELFEQSRFLNCHKEVLESFLQAIQRKNVRDLLDKEFNLIRKKQSLIFKVINAIINRQNFLEKIKAAVSKLNMQDKQNLELVDHYRTSTLAVVEEILKWKETWHTVYYQVFKKPKIFDLVYQTQNYLLTLMASSDQILHQINQEKQSEHQIKKELSQVREKASPKKQQEPQQKIHTSQSIDNKLPAQSAQKQESPQKPKQNSEIENKKLQQPELIIASKKIEPNKNDVSENAPTIQQKLRTQEVQKPKIKVPTEQSPYKIISSDPFLISLHSIEKEDKSYILKIRACELLLIEESYNFLKK